MSENIGGNYCTLANCKLKKNILKLKIMNKKVGRTVLISPIEIASGGLLIFKGNK
jgi:hypothetical protein